LKDLIDGGLDAIKISDMLSSHYLGVSVSVGLSIDPVSIYMRKSRSRNTEHRFQNILIKENSSPSIRRNGRKRSKKPQRIYDILIFQWFE
jgi:hypothetical protein